MKAVHELTGYNFREIYMMSAMEFFAYIAYINYDRRRQESQIRKMQKHK